MPAAEVPSFKDWYDETNLGMFHGRSSSLKRLDEAIKAFHAGSGMVAGIAAAWKQWSDKPRKNQSGFVRRNQKFAVSMLRQALIDAGALDDAARLPLSGLKIRVELAVGVVAGDKEDALDKAFADAYVALKAIGAKLAQPSPETRKLVELWFGTTPVGDVADKFKTILDALADFKASSPDGKTFRVLVENNGAAGVMAAASPGNINYGMVIYEPFFGPDMARSNTVMFKRMVNRASVQAFLDEFQAGYKKLDALKGGEHSRFALELGTKMMKLENDNRTRFGIIIHEFTHICLRTDDHAVTTTMLNVPSADAGYHKLGKCYGGVKCSLLAKAEPDTALDNADNYRMFAESCLF